MRIAPRTVSYLFSSALAGVIFPIFYIFVPIFAVRLGANALELGLVGGSSYAVYSFMPFVMGHFSDRRGLRQFFIFSSFLILSVVSLLYSVSTNPVSLIAVRIFEGIGWAMLWPAIEAAVTEDTLRDSKSSLAIFNYTWSGGAALGPVIGTLLVTAYSYRFAFFASGLLFAVPIFLNGVVFLKERRAPSAKIHSDDTQPDLVKQSTLSFSVREILLSSDPRRNFQVWTALVTMALSTMTSAVFFTFFGPYASSLGITVLVIGEVTTMFGVVRLFVYFALAKQSLRHIAFDIANRNRNIIAFTCLASLSPLLLFVRDTTATVYFTAFGLFAIGFSMVYAISQATLIAETPIKQRGAGAGLFESSLGLGGLVGPTIAGTISSGSLANAFIVPVAGLAPVLLLLLTLSSLTKASRTGVPGLLQR